MNKIDQLKRLWAQADCVLEIVDAPKDAQTFDKMLVVFADEMRDYQALACLKYQQLSGRKIIRRVSLYNSKTDTIVSEY
jgi:hypothetical protein